MSPASTSGSEPAALSGSEPIAIAGPPGVEEAVAHLVDTGRIHVAVRAVTLDPEGDPGAPGSGANIEGVRILWRQGRASGSWAHRAVDALGELAWLHSDFVGIDTLPVAELARRGVVVTNGTGSYSRPMAEWVVLAMLSATKELPVFVRRSDAGIWEPSPELAELEGSVALFLGLGSVGSLAAPMAAALGVEVRGVARSARPAPPPGVDRLVPAAGWRSQLGAADFVVCALPLTPQTAGMLDAEAFRAMKPTAWLINVARGELVDEAALVRALDKGEIGGAVLDAYVEEPLPTGHPLWGRPNVIVVPHHTWSSSRVLGRMGDLFASQLHAWVEGRPLRNQVDLVAGY